MLPSQVSYWTYLETQRHNIVQESQTDVANQETIRHDRAMENYYFSNLQETKRHNLRSEDQTQQSIYETIRHNQVTEENQRIQANASMLSAKASMLSATAAMQNVAINQQNADSNRRSSLAAQQQASVAFSRQRTEATTALYNQRKLQAERSAANAKAAYYSEQAQYMANENMWYDLNAMFNLVKPVIVKK